MNYSAPKSEIKSQITRQNVETVLPEVIQMGRLKLVKWIFKKWPVDNLDNYLMDATKAGQFQIVEFLHANGADIQARDNLAIMLASGNGHLQMVRFLHANGADIHADRNYAIKWASRNGHLPVVQFLHANGADIHADRNRAIKLASKYGHLPVVRFLHAHGADIMAINECHVKVTAYITAQKWLVANVSLLKRKAASVFVTHHKIMPKVGLVPTDVLDILEAAQA